MDGIHSAPAQIATWQSLLASEKTQPYFQKILTFLEKERAAGKVIYPAQKDIFNALKLTSFADVRVVILGQDPIMAPDRRTDWLSRYCPTCLFHRLSRIFF